MASNRPAIPEFIARKVLVESGHRCAVCGAPAPLERAHIIPFRHSKSHKAEDLICLCANCHSRADHEGWGEQALREYKSLPWVLRQPTAIDNVIHTTTIQMTIGMELQDFDERHEDLLRYALAGLLGISPKSVKIISKQKGSTKLTIEMPADSARELVSRYRSNDQVLRKRLFSFSVRNVVEHRAYGQNLAGLLSICEELERERAAAVAFAVGGGSYFPPESPLRLPATRQEISRVLGSLEMPPYDAKGIVVDALTEWQRQTSKAKFAHKDLDKLFLMAVKRKCGEYWRNRREHLYRSVDAAILEILAEAVEEEREAMLLDMKEVFENLPRKCMETLSRRYGLDSPKGYVADNVSRSELSAWDLRCLRTLTYELIRVGFSRITQNPPPAPDC